METTRSFASNQYADGLESWSFLNLRGKVPLFTSAFGDVFFSARNGVWFLDTVDGTLERVCKRESDLHGLLGSSAGKDKYLWTELVAAAESAGIVPQGDEVLDFTRPPALGGLLSVRNIGVMDFVVKLNIAGQIHAQIGTMKPGTKISGVSISEQ
jgi:hypothetical protein